MSEDPQNEEQQRREKSFRGISVRLAVKYLENLGGEALEEAALDDGVDATVVGDDWQATLTSESVEIGPTMELTEVTVVFEGDSDRLDELDERFSRKAMRAGG